MRDRQIIESPWEQGSNEKITYTVTIPTTWGSSPASPTAVLYQIVSGGDDTNVSSTSLSGSASVNGQVITTPLVQSLTAGEKYRLRITWTDTGKTLSAYGIIKCVE